MRLVLSDPRLRLALAPLAALVIGACHDRGPSPFAVYGPTTATFSIKVGQEIDIQMQNAGPGVFEVPPTLSGSALEFLEETTPGQPVPAGITQLFHFKGVTTGTTIITFQSTGGFAASTVVDTVNVR